jgi:spermidine/putrescine transport system ATP-binding protein
LVAGLEDPTEGKILIGGKDVTKTKAFQRPVNTVFQSYALFPHLTVLENVAFGLHRRKIDGARELAREALALVELAHVAQRKPSQLSGGQQQRVAIARALSTDPSILMGDEPTGNLDSRTSREVIELFKQLNETRNLTVILVTHDLGVARNAKRNIVLRDGKIISDTTDHEQAAEAIRASSEL